MRRLTTFACQGATLAASIDPAAGATGLLIVTGGTQVRIGAHRGMMQLAATVAAAGCPAFRFDRRGVGDSEGDDPGFAGSGPDIAAAVAAFRRECPHVERIVGFGLCDGATALAMHHAAAGLDGLILANPWTVEPQAGLPPAAAIRRRYAERLLDPKAWWRLASGAIDYRAALRGLASIVRRRAPAPLAHAMGGALAAGAVPVEIVLASGDATAIAFDAEWQGPGFAAARRGGRIGIVRLDTRSHSFAAGDDPDRLAAICVTALAGLEAAHAAAAPPR
ncbi:hydrolase 1, exosortase A system-associated [Sphingomonas profundi]|uniref:hydrolase 1, exosortase A system-associated n=1 Tax=Alterirhizorhabdus profundi TaxID=2681549 RepID=UPI0012E7F712|nr:hydrolase 1, exosortase A system-associated [Sphingomonas profundi]